MSNKAIHCRIIGKVQGVNLRSQIKAKADKLNIKGWVKNMADGSVEAYFSAPEDRIALMQEWLPEGPTRAIIQQIIVNEQRIESVDKFEIIK
ncbi:MAG: acylphosphatase [Francisellaceae bacterium]|nr:acylphosphatase [Francisellaceae bacterium]